MHDYSKSPQVDPPFFQAFGITISSRYGIAFELVELLRFAKLANERKVAHYVKEAYYNSKAHMCSFTLEPIVQEGDAVAYAIHDAAEQSVSQFLWFDSVYLADRLIDYDSLQVA